MWASASLAGSGPAPTFAKDAWACRAVVSAPRSADAFRVSPAAGAARSRCRAPPLPLPPGLIGCRLSKRTAEAGAEAPALEGSGRGVVAGCAGLAEAIPAALALATEAAATAASRLAAAADAANAKGEAGRGFALLALACRLAAAADAAKVKGEAGRGFALPALARGVNNLPAPVSYGFGTLGVTRGFAGGRDSRAGDSAGPAGVGAASVDGGVGVAGSSGRRFRRKLTSISAAVTPCFGGEWTKGMASAR